MGKQKLTRTDIKFIKHLHNHRKMTQCGISCFLGYVSRPHVNSIIKGRRWSEVPQPTEEYGEELYYRFMRKGTINYEE